MRIMFTERLSKMVTQSENEQKLVAAGHLF